MIKKENKQVNIVATPDDLDKLDYLVEKLGLRPTQIYRLALSYYYRKERKELD